ncbi:MAG: hypothetical protein HYS89_01095 [Candidatus Colwellbacteria bacterium]|nr:hypothetical protein [Candidatus Colwellbacteria bacterium]
MRPEAIALWVIHGGREGRYRFTCPACSDVVDKPADRKIVSLLVSAGVDVVEPESPATAAPAPRELEPSSWRELHWGGPAFTVDDVIAFGLALESASTIEIIASAHTGS